MEDGIGYAKAHLYDWARLGLIVRAHSAAEVAANLDPSFPRPEGTDDTVAYWSGFAHGVQRVVARLRASRSLGRSCRLRVASRDRSGHTHEGARSARVCARASLQRMISYA